MLPTHAHGRRLGLLSLCDALACGGDGQATAGDTTTTTTLTTAHGPRLGLLSLCAALAATGTAAPSACASSGRTA